MQMKLKNGGAFTVREFMTLFIFREIFIERCYDVDLPEDPVIVDVGANTGLFALRARSLWPRSTIHCYEPYPPNAEQLRATAPHAVVFPEGVGGYARQESLHVHPRNIGGHSLLPINGAARISIKVVDLRQVLARTPRGCCDLLKLDCEGAEKEILLSVDADMAARISRIVYEFSAGDGREVKAHLAKLGYRVSPLGALIFAQR